jgi:lysylphosphatidylglycerol synthetase-like protein (DUF2156 family)
MEKRPVVFTVALGFILLNAVNWLAFAVVWFIGDYPYISVTPDILRVMAAFAAIAGVTMIVLHNLLRKRNKPAYYLTLGALVVVILLTSFDQVGIPDLVYLAIALTPSVLLLVSRKWYFHNDQPKG